MSPLSRRAFLKASLAAGTAAGALPLHASIGKATDMVTLGKSGMKVTRLAFGTGSANGHVQARSARKNSPASFTTPTTAASASLRLPSLTSPPPCSAKR